MSQGPDDGRESSINLVSGNESDGGFYILRNLFQACTVVNEMTQVILYRLVGGAHFRLEYELHSFFFNYTFARTATKSVKIMVIMRL